jgi:predicted acyl esterase
VRRAQSRQTYRVPSWGNRLQQRSAPVLVLLAAIGWLAVACFGGAPLPHHAQRVWPPPGGRGPCPVSVTKNVAVPMRDGTVLRADVYQPTADQPVPVILYRTQYNKEQAQIQPSRYQSPDWFASHCYLVVTQDIRGMYASAGTFSEFSHDQDDGYDSVEWAARLPGSTGKVGMYGSSYVGATQWLAAETAPPHLVTIVPANTASDYYQGWTYESGAFRLNFIEPWVMDDLALAAAHQRGDNSTATALTRDARTRSSPISSSAARRCAGESAAGSVGSFMTCPTKRARYPFRRSIVLTPPGERRRCVGEAPAGVQGYERGKPE